MACPKRIFVGAMPHERCLLAIAAALIWTTSVTNSSRSRRSAVLAPSPPGEEDWRARSDFNTLREGEEVRADPERHRRALAHGTAQVRAMRKVLARGQRVVHPKQPPGEGFTRGRAF